MWKMTGAFATLAIDNLRLYDQSDAQWIWIKSKSPFLISFLATRHLLIFCRVPLLEYVLQDDALQPSGGWADKTLITEDMPPGAISGPT